MLVVSCVYSYERISIYLCEHIFSNWIKISMYNHTNRSFVCFVFSSRVLVVSRKKNGNLNQLCPYYFARARLDALSFWFAIFLYFLIWDPFIDDNVEFARRLRQLNVEHELFVVDEWPHGFLDFGMASIDVAQCNQQMIQKLQQIVKQTLSEVDWCLLESHTECIYFSWLKSTMYWKY